MTKAFNREEYIWKGLQEHYNEAVELMGGNEGQILGVFLQGSQNYNLDINDETYQSDIDTKCIILPSFDDFVKGYSPKSTTHERKNDEHIDLKDLRVMFDTFKKQNVNFVEVLFTPYFIANPMWEDEVAELRELGERLVHCHPTQTIKTMYGMATEKDKALKHPYPKIEWKIKKWGYDGKQLHHIIRIAEFAHNYVSGMPFAESLTSHDPDYLKKMMKAKRNGYTLEEAEQLAKQYLAETREILDKYIAEHGESLVDPEPYKRLDELKTHILREWFTLELIRTRKD